MQLTGVAALVGLAGMASASLDLLGLGGNKATTPASFDLSRSYEDHILFNGVSAPKTETSAPINLGLSLPQAQLGGIVTLGADSGFLLDPTIRLGLGGVQAYLEVDLKASAAVSESLELFASPALDIDLLNLLDVKLDAAFALDLLVAVDAAIDVKAGIYLEFAEGSYVDISLLSKDVKAVQLDGLKTKALPIGVAAEVDLSVAIKLELGLRLRSQVALEASVGIAGLDLLDGKAQISLWVSLFDYTAVLVAADDCLLSVSEYFAVDLGLAVKVDIDALDLLDISLAPSVFITLADLKIDAICLDDGSSGNGGSGGYIGGNGSDGNNGTGNISSASSADAATATSAGSGMVTSTQTSTATYTITSCAATVPHCPASYTQKVVTSTVIEKTTVCPATMTAAPTSTYVPPKSVTTITDKITTIVPCKTRSSSTYTAPSSATKPNPTITIVDTTTYCPVTATETHGSTYAPSTVPASNSATYSVPMSAPESTTYPASTYPPAGSSPAGSSPVYSSPPAMTYSSPSAPAYTSTLVVPPPSGNWTSMRTVPCPPSSTPVGVPPVSSPSATMPGTSPTAPGSPVTGAAGAVKVGMFALAIPVVLAAMI